MIDRAILLAAGLGSRLLPLTADRPKCLIEVGGRTILEHQVEALRMAGVGAITIVGGYRLAIWTWGSRNEDREEVKRLSGTNEVPILVLDDGEVVSGSGAIARWAKEHPSSPAKVGA